jgi:hypothetical protein
MTDVEARQVLAVLLAYFPRMTLPPETVGAWASGLAPFDVRDAVVAANEIGRHSKFWPTLAELIAETKAQRSDRLVSEPQPELPASGPFCSFEEFLAANPDMAERWCKVQERSPYGLTLRRLSGRRRRER